MPAFAMPKITMRAVMIMMATDRTVEAAATSLTPKMLSKTRIAMTRRFSRVFAAPT